MVSLSTRIITLAYHIKHVSIGTEREQVTHVLGESDMTVRHVGSCDAQITVKYRCNSNNNNNIIFNYAIAHHNTQLTVTKG